MTMNRLTEKVVLITGGSSGIGLATAKLFRAEGARLVVTGRSSESLARLQNELGDDALVIRSDAGKLSDIESLMQQVKERLGRLDVLFINAGVASATPIDLVSEDKFDEIADVNFKGPFFTIQKALPLFSGNASVIVTTSIANRLASPNFSIYGASKAALRSLVQSLSVGLIERGVRINAISPGPIDTPIFSRFGLADDVIQARKREMELKSPIKRFGTPEEIAKIALFLASDDSSYMVGEEVVVDGGMSLL
jgi:NAD(P)-dependent dehydrogenase (short-subunit alcohol dehydrogenase family)